MYNQEVYDIIKKLREKVKDKSLDDDLNMLSLYSEMRSNALSEYEKKEDLYKRKIDELEQGLDSADAAIDSMEVSNRRLRRFLKQAVTSSEKPTRSSIDEDDL